MISQPSELLSPITSPWPFAQWGINLIKLLPIGKGQTKFAMVAVDYFTKWVEVEPLATITEAKTTSFVRTNIVCRFGIPHTVMSNNGKYFDNPKFKEFCGKLGIKNFSSSLTHPQANGQVEAVNKIIKCGLKVRLEDPKGSVSRGALGGVVVISDNQAKFD